MTDPTGARSPARFICILANPRTGSSRLTHLLKTTGAFNVMPEPFHPNSGRRFSPEDRAALSTIAKRDISEAELLSGWHRQRPTETLEMFFGAGAGKPVVYKLFVGHLTPDKIASDIFAREDTRFLVLRRRPIDCFISALKAKIVGRYHQSDTTPLKPPLQVATFARWATRTKQWYDWIAQEVATRGLACVPLTYEEHLEDPSNAAVLSAVLTKLESLGVPSVRRPAREIAGRERQDKDSDFRKRVANWGEFEMQARADPIHAALLEWALTNP